MKFILFPITFPLSLLYGLITSIRNKFFDWGWMRELEFEIPLISIGNLAVGGTGKTPHIAYLMEHFTDKKVAVLSRGYGRGTKGFRLVKADSKPIEVGDEILMLKQAKPEIPMAVHENRALGIAELLNAHPEVELILLDDAFQHRHVKPKLNILLTEYKKPFYKDWPMPFGRLREWRSGYKRADVVVLTKCPSGFSPEQLQTSVDPRLEKDSFFSTFHYQELKQGHGTQSTVSNPLLLTSIAKPEYLLEHLRQQFPNLQHKNYRDHYSFTQKDIDSLAQQNSEWICTAKDWVKLRDLSIPEEVNIWVQEIKVEFIGEDLIDFARKHI